MLCCDACCHMLSVFLQKSGKAAADLDLPPHMLNKHASSSQAASSKPPLSHQSSTCGPTKATVLPIPMTGQTQPSPSSKSKKAHDQSPGKSRAQASAEESPTSSRPSTPSGKGKQRSQDSRGINGRPDVPSVPSPAAARRVVPIKLDRGPRQTEQQAGSSRQPSDSAQHAAASNEAQVRYKHDCKQPNYVTHVTCWCTWHLLQGNHTLIC